MNHGVQITVHKPNEDPLPDNRGFSVPSGSHAMIQVTQVLFLFSAGSVKQYNFFNTGTFEETGSVADKNLD